MGLISDKRYNVCVSAAALRSSGALTVYKQFLDHLNDNVGNDIYWIFIDPDMPRKPIKNVHFISIELTSLHQRIVFDWFDCKRILKRKGINPDCIVSLQNTGIKGFSRILQIVYYHQSIPFYSNRWNLFNKFERRLFLYKHFYPWFVKHSLSDNTKVVVQIPYIKKKFIERFKIREDRVFVLPPDQETIDISSINNCLWKDGRFHFLYPATPYRYKNHEIILKSLIEIKKTNPGLYNKIIVHFTIQSSDLDYLNCLLQSEGLLEKIDFCGEVAHDMLLEMYASSSGLLFPSTIETVGLPLSEAAAFGLPIVASDLDYSHEVLNDYSGVVYCDPKNVKAWSDAIIQLLQSRPRYTPLSNKKDTSWDSFFQIIHNHI